MRPVAEKHDPLAMLADAAAADEPPPIVEADLDQMVDLAVWTAKARRNKRRQRGALMMAAASALLIVGAGGWWLSSSAPPSPSEVAEAPMHLQLPSGDRVSRLGDGELEVVALEGAVRTLSMSGGEALFDVAPLEQGGRFEVRSPHLTVRVVGTVFAMSVGPERTHVQVFEGAVEVLDGGEVRRVDVGETYDSLTRDSSDWRTRLAALGREAANRRRAPRVGSDTTPDPLEAEEGARAQNPAADPALPVEDPAPVPALRVDRSERLARELGPLVAIDEARRWLAAGEVDRTLRAARRARRERPHDGEWAALLGDAIRVSGDFGAAADEYDRAATISTPSRATQAGYLAAQLRLRELSDPEGALQSLERARAAAPGSPIEEPATVLQTRAQVAAGQMDAARASARRYLARFPAGSDRDWMQSLVDRAAP